MADISPKLNSSDQPNTRASESPHDVLNTANALKNAVDTLATSIDRGTAIQRAEARNQFEIALTNFSQSIEQTAE